MNKLRSTLLLAMFMLTSSAFGQQISGVVVDDSNQPLIGASVLVEGTSIGTSTGLDGSFSFDAQGNAGAVLVSYIGYEDATVPMAADLGRIVLQSTDIGLDGVEIVASVAQDRKTPVAQSTLDPRYVAETYGGSTELPEVLRLTPGVYATKQGGGVGDSRINIRGFDQRNVAVLINGVPVNDMENGWVYWSNWAGLGDAVKTIQVQRGLGASKLAINSIGGTMNIITKSTDADQGGSVQYQITDYGQAKLVASAHTGLLENGLAVSAVFSRTEGDGYVDGTWFKGISYFLSISKQLSDDQLLVFTGVGAPQTHGQRTYGLSPELVEERGIKWNQDWGYLEGKRFNERVNYYHKPQFALNHYWDMSNETSLATSIYTSFGHGGGSGRLRSSYPRDENGLIDGDAARAYNIANIDKSAEYVQRNSVNNHIWYGAISTLNTALTDNIDVTVGIDGRYYKGEHFREVRNLLGAEFYNDRTNGPVGVAEEATSYINVFEVTPPEERVAYDNDGIVKYFGGFGQIEYSTDQLSTFLAASVNTTSNQRVDRMVYRGTDRSEESEVVTIGGYNAKVGVNYNINDQHNVYANAGIFSRAPFFSFVFVNYGNDVAQGLTNERAQSYELGYGFRSNRVAAKVNAYHTTWMDKSLLSGNVTTPTGVTRALINGAGALHRGVEVEFNTKPIDNLDFGGILSLGDWTWQGDVEAVVYSETDPSSFSTVNAFTDGLKVGDAPQSQYGFKARYQLGAFFVGATYVYNDKFYADFDPSSINDAEDKQNSYQLPSYGTLDARVGADFAVGDYNLQVIAQGFNLTDEFYWSDAQDAGGQGIAYGFPGFGRNFNLAVKVDF